MNSVNASSSQGSSSRSTNVNASPQRGESSWRHPHLSTPPDTFTKLAPPERAEVPPPFPETSEARANFLMERLPDQGSAQANASLRQRLITEMKVSERIKEFIAGESRRILGHRLDDPRQDIMDTNNLLRALQNATPEEQLDYTSMLADHLITVNEQAERFTMSLTPETQQAYLDACIELQNLARLNQVPAYHDIFPLPSYDEVPTPAYGKHQADKLLEREMPGTWPDTDVSRDELLRPFKNLKIPSAVKEGFANLLGHFH